ncbi:MAG TPA: pyridoxamine 5'-phosphate oxidase [Vicinamibacterales bacterium]|nr:pyridoxamine 5'-phosphate oxidase [Vicinamibacterales bacterium]
MKDLRREYASRSLEDAAAAGEPMTQFKAWFADALDANLVDANAMSVATASASGEPSVRTVLLKEVDDRGFIFFTHYTSPKGRDLTENPRASLLFFWAELERQVRVSGAVTRVSREASAAYFASRPIDSQWAAWAAPQSAALLDRESLERNYAEVKRRFENQVVPCPPDWGGFHVAAERIEFWQGRPGRLHDRILYTRNADGAWGKMRIAP